MGIYNGAKKMAVSNESSRQTFTDNGVEEDRERDGPKSSSTTWRTCGSRWRTQGIVLNGEGESMWLTTKSTTDKDAGTRLCGKMLHVHSKVNINSLYNAAYCVGNIINIITKAL